MAGERSVSTKDSIPNAVLDAVEYSDFLAAVLLHGEAVMAELPAFGPDDFGFSV